MDFAIACTRVVAVPYSDAVVTRAATAFRRSRRPFVSLRSRSEFSRLYREGDQTRIGSLVVISAEGQPGLPRVGFVAGRRVGNAVVRNRAKRRLREAMARVALRDGMTHVVIAQPGSSDARFSQLVGWLDVAIGGAPDPEEDG